MKIRFAVAPQAGSLTGDELLGFSDALERSGFDGVWLSDLPVSPMLDPMLALAMIAGRTGRLHLGANIVPFGRNPYILAKELAQLDQLARGRLLLSFVTGLNRPGEREVLDLGDAGRGAVLEEALKLVRAWWAGETVEHHTARWDFTGVASPARPIQDPLEVWLGGRGPKALDRAGRIADGWLGAHLTGSESGAARVQIQAAAGRAGRDVDPEHFGMSIPYARTSPDPVVLRDLRTRRPDVDPLAVLPVGKHGLRALIGAYIDQGLSKFVVRPASSVDSWEDEAAWLADAILDLQT